MSVAVSVLGGRSGGKLLLLAAPGHGKGKYDANGGCVGCVHPKDLTAIPAQYMHPIRHCRCLRLVSVQIAFILHRDAGMLRKLIPGVDRGMRKGSPSFAVFSSPPIGLHRP